MVNKDACIRYMQVEASSHCSDYILLDATNLCFYVLAVAKIMRESVKGLHTTLRFCLKSEVDLLFIDLLSTRAPGHY